MRQFQLSIVPMLQLLFCFYKNIIYTFFLYNFQWFFFIVTIFQFISVNRLEMYSFVCFFFSMNNLTKKNMLKFMELAVSKSKCLKKETKHPLLLNLELYRAHIIYIYIYSAFIYTWHLVIFILEW